MRMVIILITSLIFVIIWLAEIKLILNFYTACLPSHIRIIENFDRSLPISLHLLNRLLKRLYNVTRIVIPVTTGLFDCLCGWKSLHCASCITLAKWRYHKRCRGIINLRSCNYRFSLERTLNFFSIILLSSQKGVLVCTDFFFFNFGDNRGDLLIDLDRLQWLKHVSHLCHLIRLSRYNSLLRHFSGLVFNFCSSSCSRFLYLMMSRIILGGHLVVWGVWAAVVVSIFLLDLSEGFELDLDDFGEEGPIQHVHWGERHIFFHKLLFFDWRCSFGGVLKGVRSRCIWWFELLVIDRFLLLWLGWIVKFLFLMHQIWAGKMS